MENLEWRSKAKVVAWVHMILLALGMAAGIAGATILTVGANNSKISPDSDSSEFLSTMVMIVWIVVGVSVLLAALEMYGAVMLLNATKPTTGASDCYRKCKIYIAITATMLVLQIIGAINVVIFAKVTATYIIIGIVGMAIRAGYIFVAYRLRQEVEPYTLS